MHRYFDFRSLLDEESPEDRKDVLPGQAVDAVAWQAQAQRLEKHLVVVKLKEHSLAMRFDPRSAALLHEPPEFSGRGLLETLETIGRIAPA